MVCGSEAHYQSSSFRYDHLPQLEYYFFVGTTRERAVPYCFCSRVLADED